MGKGKVIFLNGVSSSGKTTLAKSLQERLTEPFYWLAADTFVDMVPKKFFTAEGEPVIHKAISMSHHTIKFFADMGVNTIVEHVLFPSIEIPAYKNQMDECVELLHEYPVLFVHVTCPLEELRRREKERGDRDIGRAEIQFPHINPKDIYDITVDTFSNSIDECVDKIIDTLNNPDKFTAFKTYWSQRKLEGK